MTWYDTVVVDSGRAPTLWLLVGFVLTFAVTRAVTRRIREAERRRAAAGEPAPTGGLLANIHIGGALKITHTSHL